MRYGKLNLRSKNELTLLDSQVYSMDAGVESFCTNEEGKAILCRGSSKRLCFVHFQGQSSKAKIRPAMQCVHNNISCNFHDVSDALDIGLLSEP